MSGVIEPVKSWLETVVIDLNLCPFARREFQQQRVRYVHSQAVDETELIEDLAYELHFLVAHPEFETSLLIHPQVLEDFIDYNQFLNIADTLIETLQLDGQLQLASFHPNYQFAGTTAHDAENFTNRSPYPMLHILREASLEKAVDQHPDIGQIPKDNIELMQKLGHQHMQALLDRCMGVDGKSSSKSDSRG